MSDLKLPEINSVALSGRLTRDPELRVLASGLSVCEFGLAATRTTKTRDGERKEETYFAEIVCWDKLAQYIGDRVRKGRPVYVEGRLALDQWTDQASGARRSKTRIVANRVQVLDWDDDGRQSSAPPARAAAPRPAPQPEQQPLIDDPLDDLPF